MDKVRIGICDGIFLLQEDGEVSLYLICRVI